MNKLSLTFLIALVALPAFGVGVSAQTRGSRTSGSAPKSARPQTGNSTPRPTTTTTPKPTPTPTTVTPSASTAAEEDCGCEAKPLPDVLATVNGIKVSKQDITPEVQRHVDELQKQIVEARKHELELQIDSRLLEAEAKKRGTTSTKLLETEVIAKAVEPTEAEAQAFYDQNKERIKSEFKDVKSDIIGYLTDRRQGEQAKRLADSLRAAAVIKRMVETATPPATPADRARVFAVVNGQNITSGDIEDSLRPLIFSVQEESYRLQNQDVEVKINDILLEQEAQKRKVTTTALLQTEVAAKVPTITEADAQKFYNENKDRINGDFEKTKAQIIQYLQQQENEKATIAFAQRLRNTAQVQTFLTPPEPPVYSITTDDQPSKGNPAAKVTIVEFTDYQCPSCAQTQPVIERIAGEYGDRIRLVVRDFPLSQHENAIKAAEAAEAAREQGKYWEYTAILFRNQSALQVDKLKEYATQLGLDRAKFDAALDSGRLVDKVRRDMLDGQRVGVNGTPTLFINGKRVADRSYEGLKAVIETALKTPAK